MSRLENWSEAYGSVVGNVYDDPRFTDGYFIRTSAVVKLDRENGTLQTKNTLYKLGKEFEGNKNDNGNQG